MSENKVVLLGQSGVGKTCIINQFINGEYDDSTTPTISFQFCQKTFEFPGNKSIALDIWDTAGQEKYRSLGRNFYKDSYIICLIFDITDKQSFKNVKEIWYPEIKKYGEKYNILSIVGNKSDLFEDEEVQDEEINSFVEEIGGQYFLVSAKNGNGIEPMFKTLANLYLNPNFKDKVEQDRSFRSNSIKLTKESIKKKNSHKKGCCN